MSKVIKQRGDYDCFLACIAMVTEINYDLLWAKEFREHVNIQKGTYGADVKKAFELADLVQGEHYWSICIPDTMARIPCVRSLLSGRRAIIQVPSLNNASASHVIYWDGLTILDPSNKQVYQWLDQLAIQWIWIFNETALEAA